MDLPSHNSPSTLLMSCLKLKGEQRREELGDRSSLSLSPLLFLDAYSAARWLNRSLRCELEDFQWHDNSKPKKVLAFFWLIPAWYLTVGQSWDPVLIGNVEGQFYILSRHSTTRFSFTVSEMISELQFNNIWRTLKLHNNPPARGRHQSLSGQLTGICRMFSELKMKVNRAKWEILLLQDYPVQLLKKTPRFLRLTWFEFPGFPFKNK